MKTVVKIESDPKKHFKIVMEKMFSYVGKTYSPAFCRTPNWFSKYEWTAQQEKEFFDWFVGYLMGNPEARRELMSYPHKDRRRIRTMVGMFNFGYGWKTKAEEKVKN